MSRQLIFFLLLTPLSSLVAGQSIPILNPPNISQWEENEFSGNTLYSSTMIDNIACIKADSKSSASGLFFKKSINIKNTPYLHWHWRIDRTLGDIDETKKDYDDYAARIYVIISGGMLFWRSRALNYVWANSQATGNSWPNAYTNKAIMIAVQSGDAKTKTWLHQKRNVLDDIKQYLDLDVDSIDAIAIMTDTDNTKSQASACYGQIYFSSQN